ncbi:SDR family oxidoreductase [Rhodobacteraceae bacterium W635]|uniref:SDR family NAD(P)-dependent oxidoreductase n=1 Tax=Nioella halotolerans TaxID=2303578 RepID=UPI000E3D9DB1|nr:SDR family oxidoreductase [Rhodobacteraceae bacterium W635]
MSRPADWALITGAGSGIGAALAQALSARGVGVVLVGRRADRLRAVQERLAADALVVPADIASAQDRALLLTAVEARLTTGGGKLRHLVHNAGIGPPSPDFAGTDPAELERAFALNVTAPLALTQAFLPALRRAAPARILMVGAGIADRAQPGTGIYGITKKALARLFEQMVTDFAHEAHTDLPAVALFQPGLVETEGLRDHVAAAQACDLPHAAWLDAALRDGQARNAAEVADAMTAILLELPSDDFNGQVLRPGR